MKLTFEWNWKSRRARKGINHDRLVLKVGDRESVTGLSQHCQGRTDYEEEERAKEEEGG